MTATKKGFPSKEIQRQQGLKPYEPVWAMVHKIRKAMGKETTYIHLRERLRLMKGIFL